MVRQVIFRKQQRGRSRPVARAELEVLACLKQHGTATARTLREAMASYRPMAHGSILTLLTRLEAKDLVEREKGPVGKAFVYHATAGAEGAYGRLLRELLDRVFGGDIVAMVHTLFQAKPPTAAEVAEYRALLRAHGSKTVRGNGAEPSESTRRRRDIASVSRR